MKNILVISLSLLLSGCTKTENGIIIKNNEVSIQGSMATFKTITPSINQSELNQTGSDMEGEDMIVHYKNGSRKIDLIFKTVSSDSATQYQIFARLGDNKVWQITDTLKLFFDDTDSIKAGIYSVLYPMVYCWTRPVQFTDFKQIQKTDGIQFAYWQNRNKSYAFAMPLGGEGFAFCLASENKGFGAVGVTGFKTEIKGDIPMLSLSVGSDFYKLIPSSFLYSFKAMGIPDNLRDKKTKPEMYNYLGWATWNAFKHDISAEKIMKAAESFKSAQIPVKWFLIDDGWLDITDNKLNSYIPDKKKFPDGFKKLTTDLKKDYGIRDIGVWHTLNGYWEGLSDSGILAKSFKDILTYNDRIVWLSSTVKQFHFINPFSDESSRFYDDWYKYLTSQGISFVKVDNQLVVKKLADHNSPFWATSEKIFNNLNAAVKKYFSGNIINCMDLTNLDFYHYSGSSVARTIEDYNPDNDSKLYSCEFRGNAAAHIIASVHNSVNRRSPLRFFHRLEKMV